MACVNEAGESRAFLDLHPTAGILQRHATREPRERDGGQRNWPGPIFSRRLALP